MSKVFVIVFGEILYILLRNELNWFIQGDIKREVWITILRVIFALIYFIIFRRTIFQRRSKGKKLIFRPLIIIPIILILTEPILIGNWGTNFNLITKIVFILTSIVVGFREEILYRGIIQNFLYKKTGFFLSLVISNIFFALSHIGFQPLTIMNSISLFLAGVFFGLIYERTGNIFICISIHALFDMIYVLTPYIDNPYPPPLGILITTFAILLVLFDIARVKKAKA